MKTKLTIIALLAVLLIAGGCAENQGDAQAWDEKAAQNTVTDDHAGHNHAPGEHTMPAVAPGQTGGEVLEAFDSGGYTYVRLKTADGETWAAGPVAEVTVGSVITLDGAMVMQNFKASSLDRTFDEIWFASGFSGSGTSGASGHGSAMESAPGAQTPDEAAVDFSGLQVPAEGRTVAQIHADRAELAGQRVKIRGKVVKSLSGIMGRNWLHLQDGSGDAGAGDHDLTITTDQMAQTGDTVLIEGVIAVDKDFGSGYFYTVIVEEATVTVEESL